MSTNAWTIAALVLYFAAMIFIGFYAYKRTTSHAGYMLADRQLHPFTAALSAGASDMSGWLLMGLPGAIYVTGLAEGWIAVGLTVGAWLNWKFVAPRLRSYTKVANDSITIPTFFENRLHDKKHILRIASGLVILFFFTFYVSSGMVAGGTFFQATFGTSYLTGMLIVSGIVVLYTLVGGFLAVSYTDVVQGIMMMLALGAVTIDGIRALGGVENTVDLINQVNPDQFNMVTGVSALAIISALGWGLGYVGQPHIIVRFMAIRSPKEATYGRRVGISWMALSVLGAIGTGLVGVAYLHKNGVELTGSKQAAETVFLVMGQMLFHPFVAGLVLAAVLAAIMSTVSSQLLVTSSALVEDLYRGVFKKDVSQRKLVLMSRFAVLTVAIVAALLAIPRYDTILALVAFAWAGFGASFGPVVLLSLYWKRLTAPGAAAGVLTGAIVVAIWGFVPALSNSLYEIIPGFFANLVVAIVVSLLTPQSDSQQEQIAEEFDAAVAGSKDSAEEV
ncbi:MAG TPA: sodium/proline symporter PutP [Corynebacteriales bacterium]|nr:sodium/proline symporter PutP [Mycobacteriales bacterium]